LLTLNKEFPMKCVVTGGAGFIGSHLVDKLLASGNQVLVIDNLSTGHLRNLSSALELDTCEFCEFDIRDVAVIDVIETFHPDVVFHLAAQADVRVSVADPGFDAEVNILGTIKVIEGARRADCQRIVAAASGGTLYGEADPSVLPVSESEPWLPLSPYGISKKAMIDYLRSASALHGLTTTSLALGNVYGPRQDPHGEAGVIAIFGQLYLSEQPVTVYGNGEQTRDYIYVDDVVNGFIAAATADRPADLINIGTGVETSVNDLVAGFAAVTGFAQPPTFAPKRPGELDRSALDITLARGSLSWKPSMALSDGLAATLDWIRAKDRSGV
jgi:UDP-glucose 4-epimerase